jgi:TPR repeat protein
MHFLPSLRKTAIISILVLFSTMLPLARSTAFAAANTVAELMRQGKQYYYGIGVTQNYATALQYYQQAAELGDADAQFISGGMYFQGLGTSRDFLKAFRLLRQAAQNGKSSPESQRILAQAYLLGSGIPKNYEKARYWYDRAAESGDKEAQNELGFMYYIGNGVERNVAKATRYFREAARQGLPLAQYNMGIIYYTGNGVEQADLIQAYAWFNLAAAQGLPQALAARQSLESALSPGELKEAQRLSEAQQKMP